MGKFHVFEKEGKDWGVSDNRIVYDGREFILDFAFGVESWFSGAGGYDGSLPASGAYHPYRYIAIGTVPDDNDGWLADNGYLEAGSGIKADSIPTGSDAFAHLPNLNDSYMSSQVSGSYGAGYNTGIAYFYKQVDRVIRIGRQVTLEATFTSTAGAGNKEVIPEGTEIRELGVFIGGEPTGIITPSTVKSDRPRALICRSVRYSVSGGYVQDNPIIVGSNPITVRYTFGDV